MKSVKFPRNITAYRIYSDIILDIVKIIKEDHVIYDFSNTRYIRSDAIPILLTISLGLSQKTNIHAKFDYNNSNILRFFSESKLYDITNQMNIFMYDTPIGYSDYSAENTKYEISYEINAFYPQKENNASVEEVSRYRKNLSNNLRRMKKNIDKVMLNTNCNYVNFTFGENSTIIAETESSLFDFPHHKKNVKDIMVDCFSEIATNSIAHSKSISFVTQQYTEYAAHLSVSDGGIGLDKSLTAKKKKGKIGVSILRDIFSDYISSEYYDILVILDALNYSKIYNPRIEKLWNCLSSVVSVGGTFKIHTLNTQILFNNRCFGCEVITTPDIDLKKCFTCIKNNTNSYHKFIVPIHGVHIEIELPVRNEDA